MAGKPGRHGTAQRRTTLQRKGLRSGASQRAEGWGAAAVTRSNGLGSGPDSWQGIQAERTSSDFLAFMDSGTSPSIVPTILIPESFFSAIMDLASSEWPTSSKSSVASLPDNVARAAAGLSADSAQSRRSSTAEAWARRAAVKHTRDLHHDLFSTGMLAQELGDIVSLAPDRQPDLMAHMQATAVTAAAQRSQPHSA